MELYRFVTVTQMIQRPTLKDRDRVWVDSETDTSTTDQNWAQYFKPKPQLLKPNIFLRLFLIHSKMNFPKFMFLYLGMYILN